MMFTEEQASEKWCPMVRTSAYYMNHAEIVDDADNRGHTNLTPESCCCIGSGCMLWNWLENDEDEGFEPKGYCGLQQFSPIHVKMA